MTTAWLIELDPAPAGVQALYWYQSKGSVYGYGWTTVAGDALRYGSEAEAQKVVSGWFLSTMAVAREHCWA